jgi:hypothetical protein
MNKDDAVLQFLIQQEGFETRTYIPKMNGMVIGKSGLTFGGGIDIGQMNLKEYKKLRLPDSLEEAMLSYVGVKGEDALAVEQQLGHFDIPSEVAMNITRRHIEKSKDKLRKAFPKFDSLAFQQQAVALSLLHNFGSSSLKYKTMKSIINGNLEEAITRLRNPDEWKNVELHPRRNREADLLESLRQQQAPQQQSQLFNTGVR